MRYQLGFLFVILQVLFPVVTKAQTVTGGTVDGNYTPGFFSQTNYVKNPSAFKNLANITASGGTVTRLTSGGIEAGSGISWTPTAAGQTLDFALNTFDGVVAGGNCEARVSYKGAGSSNVNLRVRQAGADLANISSFVDTTQIIPASPNVGSKTTPVSFLCGDGTATTVVRLTSLASGSAIIVGKVYAGLHQTSVLPANNLSDLTNAATARTNLGLGTLSILSPTGSAAANTFLSGLGVYSQALIPSSNLSDLGNIATARSNLGLGTLATVSPSGTAAANTFINGSGAYAQALIPANNLSDLASATTARSNLGLGTLATITPTGTASATTYLRGDNTWVTPTGAVWGNITGTLSNQTDLQTALNATAKTANNLSDLASASTARTNLGLGTLATVTPTGTANSGTFLSGAGSYIPISKSNLNQNYIVDTDATSGSIGTWAAYANTAQALPVNGTGGSPTVTLATSTTAPLLYGSAYYVFTHPASNTQGQGVAIPFTIDAGAQGRMLQISIPYTIGSGTYSGGTPTTDSDMEAYIYDVTNGVVIQPNSFKFDCAVVNTNCQVLAPFQAASNSTSYRLILHNATTTASAYTMKFTQVTVNQNIKSFGAPVSDWIPCTTTTSWSAASSSTICKQRRVGDTNEYSVTNVLSGAPTGALTVNLPAGQSIDVNKLSSTSGAAYITENLGTIEMNQSGQYHGVARYNSTTSITAVTLSGSPLSEPSLVNATTPVTFASGAVITIGFKVPIVGQASNIQLADQSGDNRVIAARYYQGTNTSQNATCLDWPTQDFDKASSVTTGSGTWKFTASAPGIYSVNVFFNGQANISLSLLKNGAAYTGNGMGYTNSNGVTNATKVVSLNAGEYIQVYAGGTTAVMSGSIEIFRLSGNSQTAIGETVNATYGLTTSTSVGAGAVIKFDTKINDSTGGYSPSVGTFTAPSPGMYKISFSLQANASTAILIYKNNTSFIRSSDLSANVFNSGSATLRLNAGETTYIVSSAAATFSGTTNPFSCYMTVERTGN